MIIPRRPLDGETDIRKDHDLQEFTIFIINARQPSAEAHRTFTRRQPSNTIGS